MYAYFQINTATDRGYVYPVCLYHYYFIVPNSTILGDNFTELSNIIIKKQCLSFLIIFVNDNTIVCCTNHKQRKRDTSGFLKISENKM